MVLDILRKGNNSRLARDSLILPGNRIRPYESRGELRDEMGI
jgi:hypothetical protein